MIVEKKKAHNGCWLRYDNELDRARQKYQWPTFGEATESMLLHPSCLPERHMLRACTRARQAPTGSITANAVAPTEE